MDSSDSDLECMSSPALRTRRSKHDCNPSGSAEHPAEEDSDLELETCRDHATVTNIYQSVRVPELQNWVFVVCTVLAPTALHSHLATLTSYLIPLLPVKLHIIFNIKDRISESVEQRSKKQLRWVNSAAN